MFKLILRIYVKIITQRFEFMKTRVIRVVGGSVPPSNENGPQVHAELEKMQEILHREAVGALVWASTMARPDITNAGRTVAKVCWNPGPAHMEGGAKVTAVPAPDAVPGAQVGRRTREPTHDVSVCRL